MTIIACVEKIFYEFSKSSKEGSALADDIRRLKGLLAI